MGIALGANVVIANAIGKGDEKTIHKAVHTSVITAVVCGLLVTLFGELFIGNLLQMLNGAGRCISVCVIVIFASIFWECR
ncbi:MAG: MATE family efflux transporter [Lachnospira pectinoschiza]